MVYRRLKQVVYSALYLAVLVAVSLGVYFFVLEPAPTCSDGVQNQGERGIDCGGPCGAICLPAHLQPIKLVGRVQVFAPADETISAVANVKNSNADFGARRFDYTFRFFSKTGDLIHTLVGTSFIHPREVKYLASVGNTPDPSLVKRVGFSITDIDWVPTEDLIAPVLSTREITTEVLGGYVHVRGVLANDDTLTLPRVTLVALLRDATGVLKGVSRTEIEDVAPGSHRSFGLLHPALPDIDAARTEVFAYSLRP